MDGYKDNIYALLYAILKYKHKYCRVKKPGKCPAGCSNYDKCNYDASCDDEADCEKEIISDEALEYFHLLPRKHPNTTQREFTKDDIKYIRFLYNEKLLTLQTIADIYKVTHMRIWRIVSKDPKFIKCKDGMYEQLSLFDV